MRPQTCKASFGDYFPFPDEKSDEEIEKGLRAVLWPRERAKGILPSGSR